MMVPTTRHSDWRRVLRVNSANALALAAPAISLAQDLTPVGLIQMGGYRGFTGISFFGTGAAGATMNWAMYAIDRQTDGESPDAPPRSDSMVPWAFASGGATLGTLVGVAGGVVLATEKYADRFTCALSARAQALLKRFTTEDLTAWAAATNWSPADNTQAVAQLPDVGNIWGFLFGFTTNGGGTATGMNALVNLGI